VGWVVNRSSDYAKLRPAHEVMVLFESADDNGMWTWGRPDPDRLTLTHSNGENVLFADGHVQWLMKKEFPAANGSNWKKTPFWWGKRP